jgi:hypothetical protein
MSAELTKSVERKQAGRQLVGGRQGLADPAAADHDIAVVENSCLAGSDSALRLVKGDEDLVCPASLDHCYGWLVAMPNLHADALRLT